MVMMEFAFDVNSLFPETITRIAGERLPQCRQLSSEELKERVAIVINDMGLASAKAQGLRAPITSYQKLTASKQILYIMREESGNSGKGVIVGILKTGQKNLFLIDPGGVHREVSPLCVLDFYIHESSQRRGFGKVLFEAMLQAEKLRPFEVAIDRPSPKFLGFLKKHYNLQSYIRQANNYVVFDQFFSTCVEVSHKSRRSLLQRSEVGMSSPSRSGHEISSTSLKSTPEKSFETSISDTPHSAREPKCATIDADKVISPSAKDVDKLTNKENEAIVSPSDTLKISRHTNCKVDSITASPNASFLNHQLHQPRRTRFNIITGCPLKAGATSNSLSPPKDPTFAHSKSSGAAGIQPKATAAAEQSHKAPYLDMRHSNRNKFQQPGSSLRGGPPPAPHSLSTYRASFKPMTGFSVGSTAATTAGANQWQSNSTALRYSKHSLPQHGTSTRASMSAPQGSGLTVLPTGRSDPMIGVKWTASSRNVSGSKLKDKWKTFIL